MQDFKVHRDNDKRTACEWPYFLAGFPRTGFIYVVNNSRKQFAHFNRDWMYSQKNNSLGEHRGLTAKTFKSATFWVECLQLSLSISRIKRQKESENDAERECACVWMCVCEKRERERVCEWEWEKYQKSVLRILKISWLWGPMLGLLCGSFCPRTLWICLCDAMSAHLQKTDTPTNSVVTIAQHI